MWKCGMKSTTQTFHATRAYVRIQSKQPWLDTVLVLHLSQQRVARTLGRRSTKRERDVSCRMFWHVWESPQIGNARRVRALQTTARDKCANPGLSGSAPAPRRRASWPGATLVGWFEPQREQDSGPRMVSYYRTCLREKKCSAQAEVSEPGMEICTAGVITLPRDGGEHRG